MMKTKMRYLVVTLVTIHFSLLMPHLAWAQPKVVQLIKQMPSYASCNYHVYPDSITTPLTPSPAGKKPFYYHDVTGRQSRRADTCRAESAA